MTKPNKNTLMVGLTANQCEVVINHPELLTDENGHGYITFSPEQARHLAHLLYSKAYEIDRQPVVIGIPRFCKLFLTPQGQLLFMIERGQSIITSYMGFDGATYVNRLKYPELMVEDVFASIDQHSADVESKLLISMYTAKNAAAQL